MKIESGSEKGNLLSMLVFIVGMMHSQRYFEGLKWDNLPVILKSPEHIPTRLTSAGSLLLYMVSGSNGQMSLLKIIRTIFASGICQV